MIVSSSSSNATSSNYDSLPTNRRSPSTLSDLLSLHPPFASHGHTCGPFPLPLPFSISISISPTLPSPPSPVPDPHFTLTLTHPSPRFSESNVVAQSPTLQGELPGFKSRIPLWCLLPPPCRSFPSPRSPCLQFDRPHHLSPICDVPLCYFYLTLVLVLRDGAAATKWGEASWFGCCRHLRRLRWCRHV